MPYMYERGHWDIDASFSLLDTESFLCEKSVAATA